MESFKKTYDKTRLAIEKEYDKTRLAIAKEVDSMGLNTPKLSSFEEAQPVIAKQVESTGLNTRYDFSFRGEDFKEKLTLIRQLYRMKELDVETYVAALRGGSGGLYIQENMSLIISWAEEDDSEEKRDILKVAQVSLVLMLRYLANGGR